MMRVPMRARGGFLGFRAREGVAAACKERWRQPITVRVKLRGSRRQGHRDSAASTRLDAQKQDHVPLMCSLAVAPFPEAGTSVASIEYTPALEVWAAALAGAVTVPLPIPVPPCQS
jgi:hypothetical protein